MSKKVSVLMCVYNEPEQWLNESIGSILEQSFSDFEFIIVNDNPDREDLRRILDEAITIDFRIKIIENSRNLGQVKSMNIGIEHCIGKYIARMDADDISYPERFQVQLNFMEQNMDIGVCGTFGEVFGIKKGLLAYPISDEEIRNTIVGKRPFIHPSVFIRKSLFDDPNLRYKEMMGAEDYGLWIDLLGKTKFHNISEVLIKYRMSKQQISHKNNRQRGAARNIKQTVIKLIFGEEVAKEIFDGTDITIGKINIIKHLISSTNSEKAINVLMENLYLSQGKYSFYASFHYLINEKKPKTKVFMKLLKRIFKHDNINSRIETKEL